MESEFVAVETNFSKPVLVTGLKVRDISEENSTLILLIMLLLSV